ncbi:phosphoribosyltransferase [Acidovorax sp. SRB_14]|uniref:phosphoribosyltransferase family protein n=1 Tax=unclassified Acidovorax TaxID=2684926 RepID=UPI00145CF096|nr:MULTISPECIES: phosphoribosyltransferase family protein [unclassified Acidovorax]NMM76610.1 phosphoribosyltransferase [Acidovorax sp. SRB_24]NMM80599.1 phosphoribosyltransferase [Acidovorax sp. SRB_14]NMM89868.1 phosphoribosyltransferase [Rhodococcus sp. SRB_17]
MFSRMASRISTQWRKLGEHLPSQCAVCRAWPAQRVCDACAARFAPPRRRCDRCAGLLAAPVQRCGACLREPPPLDACIAAVEYAYPWTGALGEFKFRGDPGWAGALATLVRSTPWAEPALEAADLVLPIPLSHARLRTRGFNQALLLARLLAPAKTDAALLLRTHDTEAQSHLTRAQRLRNLRGAFAVEPLRARQLQGTRVLLVDDVMTTGATLHAAALALRQAGAAHITGLVVARTERRD